MSKIPATGSTPSVTFEDLAIQMIRASQTEAQAARGQRDAQHEREMALRQQAIEQRKQAAERDLGASMWGAGGGLVSAGSGIASGALGFFGHDDQATITQSSGALVDASFKFGEKVGTKSASDARNGADQLDVEAQRAKKLGDNFKDAEDEAKRIKNQEVQMIRQLEEKKDQTRLMIARG